jgi:signal transduction histidine kinase
MGIYQAAEKAGLPLSVTTANRNLIVTDIFIKDIPLIKGDIIKSVNNHSFNLFEEIEVLTDGLSYGDTVIIAYSRDNLDYTASVSLIKYYSEVDLTAYSFSGLFFFLVGILVILKSFEKKSARLFHAGCIGAAMTITMTLGSYIALPLQLGYIIRFFFYLAYSITPVIFVHFTLTFPKERKERIPLFLISAYVFAFILSLLLTIMIIQSIESDSTIMIKRYIWVYDNVLRIFLIICFILAITVFIFSYRKTIVISEKKKLKWILFGFVIGPLSFLLLWAIPINVIGRGLIPEYIVVGLLGAVPVTFAIAILKYHVFDIDIIINRSIVYLIALSGLIITYVLLFTAITFLIKGIDETIPAIISVVIVAVVLHPIKNNVQRFVDKKFFRIQYNYREALKKFLDEIDNSFNINVLAEKIVRRTNELIPVEKIGFFILKMPESRVSLIAHKNFDFLENRSVKFSFGDLKSNLPRPVALSNQLEQGVDIEEADTRVFKRWGMALVFPFKSASDEIFGFLVLGKKKSGARFTVEDIDLLNAVKSKAATTIEKIRLQENLIIEQLEKEKLAELNEMKSFFVSSVSHDVKTPLTSIKMFTDLLKNPVISKEKYKDYLKIIEGETDRLTRLINNILDLTKIEKGIMQYNLQPVSLEELVKDVIEIMEYQLEMNSFIPEIYLSNNNIINADRDAVIEAIINLVSNAMKYSGDSKKIFVETFCRNNFACVKVKDFGIGISKENLENIFQLFFRAKTVEGRKIAGTGIGLTVVKYIVDAHNGKIEVESELGKGSSFTLMFPLYNNPDNKR